MSPRAPAMGLKDAMQHVLRTAQERREGRPVAEVPPMALAEAMRTVLRRHAERRQAELVIVAVCIRCQEVVRAGERKVETALGYVHARHVNGRLASPGQERGEGAAERAGPSAIPADNRNQPALSVGAAPATPGATRSARGQRSGRKEPPCVS